VDNYGVRVLDLSKIGYIDDPWILANRATKVFYAEQILSKNEKKIHISQSMQFFLESNKL
jgi:hypothetical protein